MSPAVTLRARLADGTLVCDGAVGTMLHAAGNALDRSLPALVVSDPDLVARVHAAYVDAAVDVVQTNTFGAGRLRLAEYGLAEQTETINRRAVELARAATAARPEVLVAGSVSSPVGIRQRRRTSAADRGEAVREQVAVLLDAGVDLVVLETFGHLDELVEAVGIACELAAAGDVPVVAHATFGPDLRTFSGHRPRDVAGALAGAPLAAIGTNCTLGPQRLLAAVQQLRDHTDLPLSAQPNAGLPRRVGPARFEYDIDAAYLVRYARQMLDAGVRMVGGCCGTTPAQLRAVVAMVAEQDRPRAADREPAPRRAPATDGGFVAVELAAGGSADESVRTARELADLGVGLVSVAAVAGTGAQINPLDLAVHLRRSVGIATMATVTTWDRTVMALQADLLGAHALGLCRVVAETGTPPLMGDYPHVDGIWDVDATGLVELLTGLNAGTDIYGLPLPARTGFEIGARINPGGRDLAAAAERARAKIAAGAQFLVTRPIYELDGLRRLLDELGPDRPPVLAAVRPLTTYAEAEFLAHEVPDVRIPADVLDRLERADRPADEVGLDLAADLVEQVRPLVDGLLIAPGTAPVATTRRLLRGLLGGLLGGTVS